LPFCHFSLKAPRPKSELYPAELKTYGDHVRAKKLDAGLLQREVADEIGVDEATVFNWEGNRTEPAVRLIPRIIQFLGYCPYTPYLPTSDWLKLVRQSLGYSQRKMADALGVDAGTLRRWEAGKRQPAVRHSEMIRAFSTADNP
jgi:transcriptional regulator with XRE-family HTH domain